MDFTTARLVHGDSAEQLDSVLAEETTAYLRERVREANQVHLALSGGSLADRALPQIIRVANEHGLDWSNVHIWFADERFVPRGSDERNATQIVAALREANGFQAENLHIPASSDSGISLDDAAVEYGEVLNRVIGISSRNRFPIIDLVLLGMGPDGHTASLFPGHEGVEVADEPVISVRNSPKPPPERISLSFPMLASARRCWVYATGASKRDALALARSGSASRTDSPVAHVSATDEVALFADADALG
ncbi:MAG: 6-phosphogluconolactonase [Gulosibacter sp.]|uniref:6-phosphogluconolactonase n=1 Tax=Gulosibacter sp. TaxID=2817531 RepID=UPI003F8F0DE1